MTDSHKLLAQSCTFVTNGGAFLQAEERQRLKLDLTAQPDLVIDGKYKVVSLIGEGGMGAIYKVHHLHLNKDMALKTFSSGNLTEEAWQRFQREARSIARLKHRNIVEVFDFGIAGDSMPYYTMALLEGESLAQRVERSGAVGVVGAIKLFLQVAEALAHAHRHNIVHRDIKPANIFLEKGSSIKGEKFQVKLIDFGIAKLAEDSAPAGAQQITQTGLIFGSPLYMSPEQSLGLAVDLRSDIYSFGCALFETLTGTPPFLGKTALATILCHQNQAPPRLSEIMAGCDLPQRLDQITARLLAKDPEQRYQTFAEIIDDLTFCLASLEKKEQPPVSRSGPSDSDWDGEDFDQARKDSNGWIKKAGLIASALALFGVFAVVLFPAFRSVLQPAKSPHAALSDAPPLGNVLAEGYKDGFGPDRQKVLAAGNRFMVSRQGEVNTYLFPTYAVMGSFTSSYQGSGQMVYCRGETRVYGKHVIFHAKEEFYKEPRLFSLFRPGDIDGLELEPIYDGWTLDQFRYFEHLTNLEVIDLSHSEFSGNAIPDLEKFPRLKELELDGSSVSGRQIADSSLLTRLERIDFVSNAEMKYFCSAAARLGRRCPLKVLELRNCGIDDATLSELAKLPNLLSLSLQCNKITGSGLLSLAALPKLTNLDLRESPIESRYAVDLEKFPSLKLVQMQSESISSQTKDYLEKKRPKMRIVIARRSQSTF